MLTRHRRWFQSAAVIALIMVVAALEANISILAKGLLGTPFLVIVAATAIIDDFIPSAWAIILGSVAVGYVTPVVGFKSDATTVFRALEFFLSGVVVYLLAVRGNTLYKNNLKLTSVSKQLQGVVRKLKAEAKGSAKQIAKLNSMNKELKALVDEFVNDDAYWSRRWTSKNAKNLKAK